MLASGAIAVNCSKRFITKLLEFYSLFVPSVNANQLIVDAMVAGVGCNLQVLIIQTLQRFMYAVDIAKQLLLFAAPVK